jgi:hypothetical protein
MTTKKTAPIHLVRNVGDSPICGVKGNNLTVVTEPGAATCGRCLVRMWAQAKLGEFKAAHAALKAEPTPAVTLSPPEAMHGAGDQHGGSDFVEVGAMTLDSTPERKPLKVYDLTTEQGKAEFATDKAEAKVEDVKPAVSLAEALNRPKKKMSDETKAKLHAKKERKPITTFLLNPVFKYKPSGAVDTITGLCPVCGVNERTIHAADAFQVKRCVDCQKKAAAARVGKAREARVSKPAAGKKAKAPKADKPAAKLSERERAVEILRKSNGDVSTNVAIIADELGVCTARAWEIVQALDNERAAAK